MKAEKFKKMQNFIKTIETIKESPFIRSEFFGARCNALDNQSKTILIALSHISDLESDLKSLNNVPMKKLLTELLHFIDEIDETEIMKIWEQITNWCIGHFGKITIYDKDYFFVRDAYVDGNDLVLRLTDINDNLADEDKWERYTAYYDVDFDEIEELDEIDYEKPYRIFDRVLGLWQRWT